MYSFAHLRHTSVWLMTAKSAVLQKGHKEVDKIITLFIKWLLNQSQGVLLKLKHNENKTLVCMKSILRLHLLVGRKCEYTTEISWMVCIYIIIYIWKYICISIYFLSMIHYLLIYDTLSVCSETVDPFITSKLSFISQSFYFFWLISMQIWEQITGFGVIHRPSLNKHCAQSVYQGEKQVDHNNIPFNIKS